MVVIESLIADVLVTLSEVIQFYDELSADIMLESLMSHESLATQAIAKEISNFS